METKFALHTRESRLDSHPFSYFSVGDIFADLLDDTRGLMAQDQRTGQFVAFPVMTV